MSRLQYRHRNIIMDQIPLKAMKHHYIMFCCLIFESLHQISQIEFGVCFLYRLLLLRDLLMGYTSLTAYISGSYLFIEMWNRKHHKRKKMI